MFSFVKSEKEGRWRCSLFYLPSTESAESACCLSAHKARDLLICLVIRSFSPADHSPSCSCVTHAYLNAESRWWLVCSEILLYSYTIRSIALSLVAIFGKPLLYKKDLGLVDAGALHGIGRHVLECDVIRWWVSYCVCGWSLLEYLTAIAWDIDQIHHMAFYLCCNYGSTNDLDLVPSFTVVLVKDVWWAFIVAAMVWISKSDPEISSLCNSYFIHVLNILRSQHQTHIIHQRGPRRLTNFQSPIPIPSRHLPCLPQELQRIHSILSRTSLSPNTSNISEASAQSHLPRYACYGYRCIG